MNYKELLIKSADNAGHIGCIGLDPVVEALPQGYEGILGWVIFLEKLFTGLKEKQITPAAFKPNQGFYVVHDKPLEGDFSGSKALAAVIKLCKEHYPEVPLILDYKRGDIKKSSHNYAVEGFDNWKADCVTVSPWMGHDSVGPFGEFMDKGVYLLNRTSNPGAADLQNVDTANGPMYMVAASKIKKWAEQWPGIGVVVGATSITELKNLAKEYKEVPMLIPGVGSQGGLPEEVMTTLNDVGYNIKLARVNSSSGLTHPWKGKEAPENWLAVVLEKIETLFESLKI